MVTAMTPPRLLTPRQVAEILQTSEAHVRRHAVQLGVIRIGSLYRFPEGVIRSLAEYGTMDGCRPESPESVSTSEPSTSSVSDGENLGASTKNAGTPRSGKRTIAPRRSGSAFARDFPEYSHLAQ